MINLQQSVINGLCRQLIRGNWEKSSHTFPSFLLSVDCQAQHKNERWLDSFHKDAQACGKSRAKGEALLRRFIAEEPFLDIRSLGETTLNGFLRETQVFLQGGRDFDRQITPEALFQALRNYLVYAVFLIMNGLEQKCHPAILAYSLLYPYTDTFLDAPGRGPQEKASMNALIQARLTGGISAPASAEERQVDALLDMIEGVYPFAKNPALYQSLRLIYDAQVNGLRQQDTATPITHGEALDISIYKGAASVLADRFLAPAPVFAEELPFYLGMGFFLQLCDDLQDIGEDTAHNSRTLFTLAASAGERERLVNQLFSYLELLFENTSRQSAFLKKNCRLLVVSCVLNAPQQFDTAYIQRLEQYFPVRASYLQSRSRYTRSTLLPKILSISDS